MLGSKTEISISAVDAHQTFVINNNYPGSAASVQVLASLPAWIAYVSHPPEGTRPNLMSICFGCRPARQLNLAAVFVPTYVNPERGAPQRL